MLLLLANAIPVAIVDHFAHTSAGGGLLIAFTIYFILFEELHWRIHMGGLPKAFQFMRRHHYDHHTSRRGAFNVFMPLFDRLFMT